MAEKMEEWMYDFAWRGLDSAFQVNDRLDNKAMNIINFSSLIIPIITGILILIADEPVLSACSSKLLMISLISLIISIIFAFMAMWLKDQGIIKIKDQFSKCSSDIIDIMGNTAKDVADWQDKVLKVGEDKRKYLLGSSYCFVFAMLLILVSAIIR